MVPAPDCILVLVLKKCEHGSSYILAELFNMCLKESHLCFLYIRAYIGELQNKNYYPVSFLSTIVLSITQIYVTFFSHFQNSFRFSQSTVNLLTVVSELLELQYLIYPRLLTEFGMLVIFTNLSLVEFQVRYLLWYSQLVLGNFR